MDNSFNSKTPPASPVKPGNLFNNKNSNSTCDCRSALEEEALNAIREFSYAVDTICISEMLPRTSELLFLNLTTLEKATYCLELTGKGWRIASNRQDCMNGDFRQLNVHVRYFESLYELLDTISPAYRDKFGNALASKLSKLEDATFP